MDRIRVSVAEGYARWAPSYDTYANGLIIAEEPLVRGLLGDVREKRVLDVACGTGRHTVWLFDQGARVTGVDPSEEMLAIARAKRPGLDVRAGAFGALWPERACFDLVLCALVMEHLPSIAAPIAEMGSLLVPGGALVLSVFHPYFLLKGVPPHFRPEGVDVEYELPSHVHMVSDYVRAVKAAGLELTGISEPLVGDEVVGRMPNMEKHRGLPIAIVLRAKR
jgi:malonyl-CoA O-methyltransferase